MIIQFIGFDAATRQILVDRLADRINAWTITDTHIPMAALQAQGARWMRELSTLHDKTHNQPVIINGYFPTAEAREQYVLKEHIRPIPDFTVYVDTIPHDQFKDYPGWKERVEVAPKTWDEVENWGWEEPEDSEYQLKIITTGNEEQDSAEARVNHIIKHFGLTDWEKSSVLYVPRHGNDWDADDTAKYNALIEDGNNVLIGIRTLSEEYQHGQELTSFYRIQQNILTHIPDAKCVRIPDISNVVMDTI